MKREGGAVESLERRPWLIRGQLEKLRRIPECVAEPAELVARRRCVQVLTLPNGIVGVLNRKRRQGLLLIERNQLFPQHSRGPGITDDVMQDDAEDVLRSIDAIQHQPVQGT